MADPITDGFSALAELLDEIEEIGIIARLSLAGNHSVCTYFLQVHHSQSSMEDCEKTEAEWDNEILDPLFNRVYIFVLTAGVELTMMWT